MTGRPLVIAVANSRFASFLGGPHPLPALRKRAHRRTRVLAAQHPAALSRWRAVPRRGAPTMQAGEAPARGTGTPVEPPIGGR
jgi:hypothetical protein